MGLMDVGVNGVLMDDFAVMHDALAGLGYPQGTGMVISKYQIHEL